MLYGETVCRPTSNETRVVKLLELTLVLEVAILGRSNWPFPAGHLPRLLYRNSRSLINAVLL